VNIPLTEAMRRALVDACHVVLATEAAGVDYDVTRPPCGWTALAEVIAGTFPVPESDRTAAGRVGHVPGYVSYDGATGRPAGTQGWVIVDLHKIDPSTYEEGEDILQMSPAAARRLGYGLFEQADTADGITAANQQE
jgi:hypothetical protein